MTEIGQLPEQGRFLEVHRVKPIEYGLFRDLIRQISLFVLFDDKVTSFRMNYYSLTPLIVEHHGDSHFTIMKLSG